MDNNNVVANPQPQVQPQPVYNNAPVNNVSLEYKPISAWGYVGYQLLFCLPLIGIIFLLVFALGGTKNINLKNYARSFFCWLLIFTVISVIVGLIFIVLMVLAGGLATTTGA